MSNLNNCLHCGGVGDFDTNKSNGAIFAKCTVCGIRTPEQVATVEFAAKDFVGAIWNKVHEVAYPEWVQPTGAHDAYAVDARVSHKGKKWVSLVAVNVWEPGVANWREA